jgi:hypothetical protein
LTQKNFIQKSNTFFNEKKSFPLVKFLGFLIIKQIGKKLSFLKSTPKSKVLTFFELEFLKESKEF